MANLTVHCRRCGYWHTREELCSAVKKDEQQAIAQELAPKKMNRGERRAFARKQTKDPKVRKMIADALK